MMYGRYGYDMMGGYGLAGLATFLFGMLVIVGIVLIVVMIARSSASHTHSHIGLTPPSPDEAVEIARRRYAHGEIAKEEFAEMMEHLKPRT